MTHNFERPKNIIKDNFEYGEQLKEFYKMYDSYKNIFILTKELKEFFIHIKNYENATFIDKFPGFFIDLNNYFIDSFKNYLYDKFNYKTNSEIPWTILYKILRFNKIINKGFVIIYINFADFVTYEIKQGKEILYDYNKDTNKIAMFIPIILNDNNILTLDTELMKL